MRKLFYILAVVALLAGCATRNVESRKKERAAAYEALSPDMKAAVDQGNLLVGMPMDGVFIAWGKPDQLLEAGSEAGKTTTWVYMGQYTEETRIWGYNRMYYGYSPRGYVRADVVFEKGVVKQWRTLPQPGY